MERPIHLINFVSEKELNEAKKRRGVRVEDGTAQMDKPLYEILKQNKDKKDAEFNERFKHRPPKALDDDETDFLDRMQRSRKEYERRIADEEAQQLLSFKAAMAAKASVVHELKEAPTCLPRGVQEQKSAAGKKKNLLTPRSLAMIIKEKEPQAKKAKIEEANNNTVKSPYVDSTDKRSIGAVKTPNDDDTDKASSVKMALVSYSDDDSEDD